MSEKTVDKEVIQRKIDIIEQNMKFLKEVSLQPYRNFERSLKDILSVKHALQESIEGCLDIANHIISNKSFRMYADYKDMMIVLKENKVIAEKLSEKLVKMVGFRNVLVHRYSEVNPKVLYSTIHEDLEDINEFVKSILRFLEKEK